MPNYLETTQSADPMVDKLIAQIAYGYWEERGRPFGSSQEDWYRAVEKVSKELELHGLLAATQENTSAKGPH